MGPGTDSPKRPVLVILTSHWVSMLGVALVTLAGFSWIIVLPANVRGEVSNPYIGLLAFVVIPAVFLLGLALIPIGIALGRNRLNRQLATVQDRRLLWRRAGIFFGAMTVVNLVVASQGSYRAVQHMDTVQFCGQTCHAMTPEFTAHQLPSHERVPCASCHIAPGASGWFKAKVAGIHQLAAVMTDSFNRPIETPMASNRLVAATDTCEQCHDRDKRIGERLRILNSYKDDEMNSHTQTVLLMRIGGGRDGGIHGAHLGPGVHIRYAAMDKERQTIPWVEYRNETTGQSRTYAAADAKPEAIAALPKFEMQCVDCHNRAAHSFTTPDKAIDGAIAANRIKPGLPFVKKTGLALIKAEYASGIEAAQKIPASLERFYRQKYPEIAQQRAGDIAAAGKTLADLYGENVFPDLKVTWGTYPNNLGHSDYPGCFRCHDDAHASADKKTITQDCNTCHNPLAMDEASPAILKSLGLE
jgi:nitrate/TMAO reductase-like tetraheme cytochrome c subunit